MHPEVLAATLLAQADYRDPKAVVRTSVYRLRQLINTNDNDVEGNYIIFKQGCYQWNTKANYWYDAQEFENSAGKPGYFKEKLWLLFCGVGPFHCIRVSTSPKRPSVNGFFPTLLLPPPLFGGSGYPRALLKRWRYGKIIEHTKKLSG